MKKNGYSCRSWILGMAGGSLLVLQGAASAALCWNDGEKLTYEVSWGPVIAAEGIFTAHQDGSQWVMNLDLKSRGMVEKVGPIRSSFTSTMQTGPWRSLGYAEDRSEGKKKKKNRTVIQYPSLKGHYEDLLQGTASDFSLPREPVDDAGSLLYAIRAQDWRAKGERLFVVYDGTKIKYGRARFVKETSEAVGTWPKQKLLVIEAWPEEEDGKRKKGSLKLWLTDDDKRLPLKADFVAKFGTFEINLVKAENTKVP